MLEALVSRTGTRERGEELESEGRSEDLEG